MATAYALDCSAHRTRQHKQDDRQLVLAAQNGDQEAFAVLFERNRPAVIATVERYLRDYNDVQEVCQEIYLRAMQRVGQLRNWESFAGWLCKVAARLAINWAARRRDGMVSGGLEQIPAQQRPPWYRISQDEQKRALYRALEQLSPLDRHTLVAFYFHDQTIEQMSRQFGVPKGTIKRRLHVARKRLAKLLCRGGNVKQRTQNRQRRHKYCPVEPAIGKPDTKVVQTCAA